jgi:2,3-bisphosphoglycerate-independent phosphoglycerate mutase
LGRRPLILIIIDGWGIATPWGGNAIALAHTPHLNSYMKSAPYTTLSASGEAVGLPPRDPGNSEVGHLTIGAGKIIKQGLLMINQAIADRSFYKNPELLAALDWVKSKKTKLHLLGLVSAGGVHSHIDHLFALLELAHQKNVREVYIHMVTDGRDTSPYAAIINLNRLEKKITELGVGTIASVSGRYFAMDRDNRWARTQKAYEAATYGVGRVTPTAQAAIASAYQDSFTDEFIPPTVIGREGKQPITVGEDDAVIFFNFRADRMRQITKAFVLPDFPHFKRRQLSLYVVTMTEYERGLPVKVAFQAEHVEHPLAEVISAHNLTQLHVAETEKYAHVTYFINGQREPPFPGESRILIPSPKVATYDIVPEMAAAQITQTVSDNLKKRHYDFVVVNFANPDMVSHTGNLKATIRACEVVDQMIGRLAETAASIGGDVVITSDHGNAEQLISPQTGDPDTSHNDNPVPLIVLSAEPLWQRPLSQNGGLSDVAPTILAMMGLPRLPQMTGHPLFSRLEEQVSV